ncbi:MAG: HPF/RaiA family ribosome-associated protein [Niastella sp.]|nr:HPF/RaiA family ribosome-associated protein [Niastella sp.]
MNYTENFEGIKIDVQAVDITIDDDVQQGIRDMITRLKRHVSQVNWVDVYFKKEANHATEPRNVSIRFGIPGQDAFATGSGEHWLPTLKEVEEKVRKQLIKK